MKHIHNRHRAKLIITQPCNKCGTKTDILKLISGTCHKCCYKGYQQIEKEEDQKKFMKKFGKLKDREKVR